MSGLVQPRGAKNQVFSVIPSTRKGSAFPDFWVGQRRAVSTTVSQVPPGQGQLSQHRALLTTALGSGGPASSKVLRHLAWGSNNGFNIPANPSSSCHVALRPRLIMASVTCSQDWGLKLTQTPPGRFGPSQPNLLIIVLFCLVSTCHHLSELPRATW